MASYIVSAALCVLPLLVSGYDFPLPGSCTGACTGKLHDPSVIYNADTDTFYRFVTNNEISIASAPSISGPWTDLGSALPNGSIIDLPGNTDLWAPDVFEYDGTYYLYYAVSTSGSQNSDIGVATSTTLEPGSWTDHGSLGIPSNNATYNRIDPNLFQATSTSPFYLSFGSFWTNIFQIPLATPPLTVAADSTITHLEYNTTVTSAPDEGSYQFWWNVNGIDYYYLFFSNGKCCNAPADADDAEAYKIMVCRSDSPNGGFVDADGQDCLASGGTLVYGGGATDGTNDVYAPGGQGVLYDPQQDAVVLYYHWVNTTIGTEYDEFRFGWNVLDFSSGWPVVQG